VGTPASFGLTGSGREGVGRGGQRRSASNWRRRRRRLSALGCPKEEERVAGPKRPRAAAGP
jgi:hypothetical protein